MKQRSRVFTGLACGVSTGILSAALWLSASPALSVWADDGAKATGERSAAAALTKATALERGEASEARLTNDIKYLASDELEGRGIGTKGINLAADFIKAEFEKAGLDVTRYNGSPFQTFRLGVGATLGQPNRLTLNGPQGTKLELKLTDEFNPQQFGGSGEFKGELVFVGYGIESTEKKYNDYEGIDIKGKIAVMMRRAPKATDPMGPFMSPHGITKDADLNNKVSVAFAKGAIGVIFLNDPPSSKKAVEAAVATLPKLTQSVADIAEEADRIGTTNAAKAAELRNKLSAEVKKYRAAKEAVATGTEDTLMRFGYGSSDIVRSIPVLHIKMKAFSDLLKAAGHKSLSEIAAAIDADMKPQSFDVKGCTCEGIVSINRKQTEVKNVVGVLEGTGPLAEETVVIGAHYDHVGRGGANSLAPGSNEIHNGADDNASGTVTLIELARRFGEQKGKLSRRVVFIAFTAEEIGLIGSARYVKEPLFPLTNTVAMLNMDMVGRLKGEKLIIYGTGTAPIWKGLVEKTGKEQNFNMVFKPEGFGPSDHSSFYGAKIPVLHFFTDMHPDYHRPGDDWQKINVPGMRRVCDMVEAIATEVVNAPERPKYIGIAGSAIIGRDSARPYFGSVPDFGVDKPGYAIQSVTPMGPAEKGGVKGGDRIIRLGMNKIDNLDDFDAALRKFKGGDVVDVTVMRGNDEVTLKVTLGAPR